jgi:hypothetical protein
MISVLAKTSAVTAIQMSDRQLSSNERQPDNRWPWDSPRIAAPPRRFPVVPDKPVVIGQ